MEFEYVVEVRDCLRDVIIDHLTFEDANSAYHEYRRLTDRFEDEDMIVVTLVEPE